MSWSAATGAGHDNVDMTTTAGAEPFTPLLTGVTGTTALIPGLVPGTTYYFTVKAVGPSGISAASNEASGLPLAVAPPTSVAVTIGIGSATLSWTASSNATSYNVYLGNSAGAESSIAVATGLTGTTTTISGLIPGQTYYFLIKGVANGDLSGAGNEVSVTPVTAAAPTQLAGTAQIGGATLTWAPATGATGYQIYLGTAAGGEGVTPAQAVVSGTSATLSNLTENTPYYFVVRAVVNGVPSGPSNEISVTPQSYPAPQYLVLTPGVGQIGISWSTSAGATEYNVFVGTAPGKEVTTPAAVVPGTAVTLPGLTSGSTYYIYVQAQTAIGPSTPTTESSATPLQPAGPANLAAMAGVNDVLLSWSAVAGATTYDVYEGATAGGEGMTPVQTGISGLGTLIGGLTAATPYYFEVRANTVSGYSVASSEVSASPQQAPGPSSPTGTAGVGDVTLAWTATPGATTYDVYQGTTAGGEGTVPVQTGITGLSTVVSGLTSGTPYYFEIRAQTAEGLTLASSEVSVTPTAAASTTSTGSTGGHGGGAFGGLDLLVLFLVTLGAGGLRLIGARGRAKGSIYPGYAPAPRRAPP